MAPIDRYLLHEHHRSTCCADNQRHDLDHLVTQALLLGPEEFQAFALQALAAYHWEADPSADAAKRIIVMELCRTLGLKPRYPKTRRGAKRLSKRLDRVPT